jgi:pimeloyl-ACP methyl ester carboxylesterase/L-ascorbate metabolism protein UlaG (beta-lactamase superfamily)
MALRKQMTAAILFALLACGAAAAQVENTVDVGGRHLAYRLYGRGTPTVVIDVGVGESFETWLPIAEELSKATSVLVYNRAGYGRSGMGPLPRDAAAEASDLKALLKKAGIKSPYILVGHSLGGMNLQVFAHEYPDGVAGLVLLDPPPRGWLVGKDFPALKDLFLRMTGDMEKSAEAAGKSGDANERSQAPFLKTIASEHRSMFGSSARSLLAVDSFGALPMVVIAASRANPQFGKDADAYQKFWIEENRKLARLSTAGEFVLAERSSHHIYRDAPEVVLAAIKKLLAIGPEIKTGRTSSGSPRLGNAQKPMDLVYVANSGVLVSCGGKKVLIDALFDKPNPEYRAPSTEVLEKIIKGRPPFDGVDLVLVTHNHPDHFAASVAARFMEAHPEMPLVAPVDAVAALRKTAPDWAKFEARVVPIDLKVGEKRPLVIKGIPVTAFRTLHGTADSPMNLMYLFDLGGRLVFHEGDSPGKPEEYRAFGLGGEHLDLALVHYWFPLEPNISAFFQKELKVDHIGLTHLPIRLEGDAPGKIDLVKKYYPDLFLLLPGMPARMFSAPDREQGRPNTTFFIKPSS